MCMSIVTKSFRPIAKRPDETVFRWKSGTSMSKGVWRRARIDWGHGPHVNRRNHRPGYTGFHVYRHKKDAGIYPKKMEVAHRLDVGRGDGRYHDVLVETYQWARLAE